MHLTRSQLKKGCFMTVESRVTLHLSSNGNNSCTWNGNENNALNTERNNSSILNHHSIAYYMLGWAILTKAFISTCVILTLGVRWCIGTQCTMIPHIIPALAHTRASIIQ